MAKQTVHMKWEKTTKNTFKFFEADEDGIEVDWDKQLIGSIYVKKTFFEGGQQPDSVTITVETAA